MEHLHDTVVPRKLSIKNKTNLNPTYSEDALIRAVKLLDIAYIISIYFVFSVIILIVFIKLGVKHHVEKDKTKSLIRLSFEIIFLIWVASVIGYILRNIVEKIPSPFNGLHGYQHDRLKETYTISSYAVSILLMTSVYNQKFNYFTQRLYNNIQRI